MEILSEEEYFKTKAISASQIKAFDRGAYWFWKQSPFNPEKEDDVETDALVFGKLCHCMLLEPEEVEKRFEVADFGLSRKNKKYLEMKGTTDKILVNPSEMERAKKMIDAIHNHSLARQILDGATAEKPFVWVDEVSGMPCKAKLDAIKRTKNGIVIIDYKTARSIDDVLRYGQKNQYAIQAEFYKKAVEAKYGEKPVEFIFIIQSNVENEEDIICVANVEYETQEVAKNIMESHIQFIKNKLERWENTKDKNIWAAYPEREFIHYSNYYLTNGEY